jgi:hypothetical protein
VLAASRRHGRLIEAPAVVQPGAAVTVAVSGPARLLYGAGWPDRRTAAARIVRFEGCSDSTASGGPARFDGGIVARERGCVMLRIWIPGQDAPLRRRVGCG